MNETKSILPDAMDDGRMVLIKSCSYLRLTDEIRIASDAAQETGTRFILAISYRCVLSPALAEFVKHRDTEVLTAE